MEKQPENICLGIKVQVVAVCVCVCVHEIFKRESKTAALLGCSRYLICFVGAIHEYVDCV